MSHASSGGAKDQAANASADEPARAAAELQALVPVLARVERGERNALEDFRRAICDLVARLRREGVPRAQVIEMVSRLSATATSPDTHFQLTAAAREALVQLSLEWCAEEYGKADAPATGVSSSDTSSTDTSSTNAASVDAPSIEASSSGGPSI